MVGFEQLKPTLVSETGKGEMYDATDCYIVPLRFYAAHLRIGNVDFKIKPEDMSHNYRVTTRFCGEFLYELAVSKELHREFKFPDFALYHTKRRKWYGVTPGQDVTLVVFQAGDRRYEVRNYYPYEMQYWKDYKVSARKELAYNVEFCQICNKSLPFKLKSRAPINGEANAFFSDSDE
jgi:hypothetical protein